MKKVTKLRNTFKTCLCVVLAFSFLLSMRITAGRVPRGLEWEDPKIKTAVYGSEAALVAEESSSSPIVQKMPSCSLNITEKPLYKIRKMQGDKWEVFTKVIGVLDILEVDYFLDYGTLLGFVRECRNFDKDFDISVSIEWLKRDNNAARLKKAYELLGFEFFEPDRTGITNRRMTMDGITLFRMGLDYWHVDLFFTYMGEEGVAENGVFYRGYNSCPRPLSGIETFQWNELQVKIPVPYDDFLRASFGDDYMIPQKVTFQELAEETLQTGRCLMANDAELGDDSGVVIALTDRQSIVEALTLVEGMKQWSTGGEVAIEIYHKNLLDRRLQAKLEENKKVKIINLHDKRSTEDLYVQALKTTKLSRVFVTRPNTVFLQNPLNILETMRYQSRKPVAHKCKEGTPCVSTTDAHLAKTLASVERLTVVQKYRNKTIPTITLKDGEKVLDVATVHETGHRIAAFAFPTRNYLKWIGRNKLAKGIYTLRTASGDNVEVPVTYHKHMRDHWELYEAARAFVEQSVISWVTSLFQPQSQSGTPRLHVMQPKKS